MQGGSSLAVTSLVLGIVSILASLLPVLGLPVSIVGLVLGILGRNSPRRGVAIGGIITSSFGLGLTLLNAILGAIMAVRG